MGKSRETTSGYKIKDGKEMIESYLNLLQGERGSSVLAAAELLMDLIGVALSPLMERKKQPGAEHEKTVAYDRQPFHYDMQGDAEMIMPEDGTKKNKEKSEQSNDRQKEAVEKDMKQPVPEKDKDQPKERVFTDTLKSQLHQQAKEVNKAIDNAKTQNGANKEVLDKLAREVKKMDGAISRTMPDKKSSLSELLERDEIPTRNRSNSWVKNYLKEGNNTPEKQDFVKLGEKTLAKEKAKNIADRMFDSVIKNLPSYKNRGRDEKFYKDNPVEKEKMLKKIMGSEPFKALTDNFDINKMNKLSEMDTNQIIGEYHKKQEELGKDGQQRERNNAPERDNNNPAMNNEMQQGNRNSQLENPTVKNPTVKNQNAEGVQLGGI